MRKARVPCGFVEFCRISYNMLLSGHEKWGIGTRGVNTIQKEAQRIVPSFKHDPKFHASQYTPEIGVVVIDSAKRESVSPDALLDMYGQLIKKGGLKYLPILFNRFEWNIREETRRFADREMKTSKCGVPHNNDRKRAKRINSLRAKRQA